MLEFGLIAEAIAATASKLEKVRLLAAYLAGLDDVDLPAATRFFTGNPFAASDQRALAIGGRTLLAAARAVWGFEDRALSRTYREHGDLGAALAPFVRTPARLELFSEPLTPRRLKALLDEIARASGKSSGRRRQLLCEQILAACMQPVEAKYVIKIMTGDLRIGLREGLVVDGIAAAFGCDSQDVRRAAMAAGDIGAVALAARHHDLDNVRIAYGAPLGFMLASPVLFGSSYRELRDAEWIAEDKFDGIRAQVHKDGGVVRIFSRTLNDVSHSYPEVVRALKEIRASFILDGELIAQRDGRVLPFRHLQARLQRKVVSAKLLADVPVVYVCFDLLAKDEQFLLDRPLAQRRDVLASTIIPNANLMLPSWTHLEEGAPPAALHERFEDARARGHEGLMLKRTDSAYYPGRRGKWWLKLKRELSTLDVVVVAVEWGHGKRAKVLSDYTFAVRDGDQLRTIGKAYSGLTDAEIAELTTWFQAHQTGRRGHAIAVEPKIVLEVAFDIIQKSTLHESGFALRFPRIVRIRDDKRAEDIDTVARVEEIYAAMLEREAGTPSAQRTSEGATSATAAYETEVDPQNR
ncbi:MAG: ATP-dependent DNA ligase [Vulcanimicrobiaceae bacterium]